MAGFIYYKPNHTGAMTLEAVAKCGLSYAFDSQPDYVRVMGGPDGKAGCVFGRADVGSDVKIGFYPDEQEWQPLDESECWIGFRRGNLPSPADLARPKQLAGKPVQLADDKEWLAPIARSWTDEEGEARYFSQLPSVVKRSGGRWVAGDVKPKYVRLWEVAEKVFDAFVAANDSSNATITIPDADYAVESLAYNYYVSGDEASILGLFTSDYSQVWEILKVLIDLESLILINQKKTALDGCSSLDGREVLIKDTAQP